MSRPIKAVADAKGGRTSGLQSGPECDGEIGGDHGSGLRKAAPFAEGELMLCSGMVNNFVVDNSEIGPLSFLRFRTQHRAHYK